jgi:hypothetical protein
MESRSEFEVTKDHVAIGGETHDKETGSLG